MIFALSSAGSQHVPYRESKLTRALRDWWASPTSALFLHFLQHLFLSLMFILLSGLVWEELPDVFSGHGVISIIFNIWNSQLSTVCLQSHGCSFTTHIHISVTLHTWTGIHTLPRSIFILKNTYFQNIKTLQKMRIQSSHMHHIPILTHLIGKHTHMLNANSFYPFFSLNLL